MWVAVPLAVSTSAWSVLNFIDRMFLMWYSEEAVAAALPAGLLQYVITCFPLGVAVYVTTFVAQYYGAGRYQRTGVAMWQGVFVGLITAPLVVLSSPLAEWLFQAIGHPPEVAVVEAEYYWAMSWGGGAVVVGAALASFFTGRGAVITVMVVDVLTAALNIGLDYAWIFGHWGLPAAGVSGAGWATSVSLWFKVLVYFSLALLPEVRRRFGTISGLRWDGPLMRRLLWFGAPNGVQFVLEVISFTIFILLVGRLGKTAMTASSLAFSLNTLAFMPVLGLGMACTTLVGRHLGENQPDLAARSTWSAFALSIVYTALIGVLYVAIPDVLLLPYRGEIDPAEFAPLRDTVVVLLWFVAAYCLFDTMNVIFSFAIKGAGDTRFVLYTTISTAGIPVAMTWVGVQYFGLGLYWSWFSLMVWILLLGMIYGARFLQGEWRHMQVIESPTAPDLLPDPTTTTMAMSAGELAVESTAG